MLNATITLPHCYGADALAHCPQTVTAYPLIQTGKQRTFQAETLVLMDIQ